MKFVFDSARVLSSLLLFFVVTGWSQPGDAPTQNWYRCNTHTHTRAFPLSDANETPDFVAQWYKAHGYQCLVITDHDYLTDVAPLNQKYSVDGNFLLIPGEEITQEVADRMRSNGYRHLHVNGINTNRMIMPMTVDAYDGISSAKIYERNFAAIHAAGGIAQVNHPNLNWSVQLDDLLELPDPFLFEVWNAYATANNLGGTDDNGSVSPSTEALWDSLLSRGKIVWAVASDDAHEYHGFDERKAPTPGKGWIVVQAASLTVPAITQALKRGKFYASTGISLETYSADRSGIYIAIKPPEDWDSGTQATTRYVTRFMGTNGRVLAEVTGSSPQYRFKGDEQYVRASIVDSDGRRAWTQPEFIAQAQLARRNDSRRGQGLSSRER